jgi:cation transport ATPase
VTCWSSAPGGSPVDGAIAGEAVLDESALTGEARPTQRGRRSGASAPVTCSTSVTHAAADSTYAAIVCPWAAIVTVRRCLADRCQIFLPSPLAVAGAAWAISQRHRL